MGDKGWIGNRSRTCSQSDRVFVAAQIVNNKWGVEKDSLHPMRKQMRQISECNSKNPVMFFSGLLLNEFHFSYMILKPCVKKVLVNNRGELF